MGQRTRAGRATLGDWADDWDIWGNLLPSYTDPNVQTDYPVFTGSDYYPVDDPLVWGTQYVDPNVQTDTPVFTGSDMTPDDLKTVLTTGAANETEATVIAARVPGTDIPIRGSDMKVRAVPKLPFDVSDLKTIFAVGSQLYRATGARNAQGGATYARYNAPSTLSNMLPVALAIGAAFLLSN
jgi:hypothetical protein